MSRIRVSELVKELGMETKAVLSHLNKMGVQVKNHLSMISDTDALKVKTSLKKTNSADPKKSGNKIFIRRKAVEPLPVEPSKSLEVEPSAVESSAVSSVEPVSNDSDLAKDKHDVTEAKQDHQSLDESTIKSEVETVKSAPEDVKTQSDDIKSGEKKQNVVSSEELTKSADVSEIHTDTEIPLSVVDEPLKDTLSNSSDTKLLEKKEAEELPSAENKQEVTDSKTVSSEPSQVETPQPRISKPSFQSATIVRRGPENVYQVNMARTQKPSGANSTHTKGRPSYSSSGAHSGANRTAARPNSAGGVGTAPRKPFAAPSDSLSSTTSREFLGRPNKDRKERDSKRNSFESETRTNKSRTKGNRFYEKTDDDLISLENSGEIKDSGINVRTMVSTKKRKFPFKRKEARVENTSANPTKASKRIIRIDEHISVNDLAAEMSQKAGAVVKVLMNLGVLATANKVLDFDTATLVANEFQYETQNVTVSLEDIIGKNQTKQTSSVVEESRPPIITIMGHVDHGKTSLLDALRQANVVSGEAGGITQHIGAYQITHDDRKLTFLDTPGHEAFTSMRARGAKVTDIVVLVVAADDGVMPQTIEAIAHSKAAGVPMIVAVNKIDKPNINLDKLNSELAEQGVISEEWGGDSMFVKVSAKTREGLDQLIEAILLQADVLELKSQAQGFAEGVVIESKRDKSRGPIATVIVTKGLLKQQDSVVIGKTMGRVRAMYNDKNVLIKEASPGTPVELIGLNNVPDAGDIFYAVASDAVAREAVAYKLEKHRQAQLASQKSTSMSDLHALFEVQQTSVKAHELNLIIKADTHGSVEAIKASLEKLDTSKVKNKVVLAAVGGITETDVVLADASSAIIIGFNARPDKIAVNRAESNGVKMMFFNIIYELIDAVKISMAGTLDPIKQDKIIGHADIRNLFTVPKIGVIAGCLVTDGKITRPCRLRVIREGIVGYTGQLSSLKRFKDDAKEVMHGFECGIGVENYNDLKVGDVLEAYIVEEVAAEL